VSAESRGHRVARRLRPTGDDYFVLKPKHSGFFSTPLDILLRYLGVDTVVLAGFAADICILLTANDAYMRDYRVVVPRDCVASNTRAKTEFTLREVREVLKGSTPTSTSMRLTAPARRRASGRGHPRGAGRVVG
ncbi:MAG TPA: isochorismatase family cysteine hydrolase, partial [Vicinamibacteria bacterium]|nr:isochorismatase family cysteine hydrolase [Vicinamibacteria bacterium]